MLKRTGQLFLILLFVLLAIVLIRTALFATERNFDAEKSVAAIDDEAAAEHLSGAIRYRTISRQDTSQVDSLAFLGLHAYLEDTYPLVHSNLQREVISGLSLLFHWPGSDPSLAPVVLMAHLDVVPTTNEASQKWMHPPFEGVVHSDYVWGRGALDDKVGVIAIMEGIEALLRTGFRPERSVFVVMGHDEEAGGTRGAAVVADVVVDRAGQPPALVVDEGGMICVGIMPGIDRPIALIGIAEKGYLSLELSTTDSGGHSSAPPPQTAIGRLSEAVTRVERNPFPPRIDGASAALLRHIGPRMSFLRRATLANLWLFGPLVARVMASNRRLASAVRTTTAATMFTAGVRENVLPIYASAVVNFRLLPGDTIEGVTEHVRRIIDDGSVAVRRINTAFDPSPVADAEGAEFALVAAAALSSVGDSDVVVAPFLVPAATDARYFSAYTDKVFRFTPVTLTMEDLSGFHGLNERVRVSSVRAAAAFYYEIVRRSDAL